jgi:predicted permease
MGNQPVVHIREWVPVAGFSITILLVLPFIFYLVAGQFFENIHYRSWVLEAAIPMGLTPYVLSAKYELNTRFAW